MRLSGRRNFASEELTRGAALASGTSIAQATVSSSIFGAAPFDKSEMSLPKYSRTCAASFSASAPEGLAFNAACKDFGVIWVSCGAKAASENNNATAGTIHDVIRVSFRMFGVVLKRRQFTITIFLAKAGFTDTPSRSIADRN